MLCLNRKFLIPIESISFHEIICFKDVDVLQSVSLLSLIFSLCKFSLRDVVLRDDFLCCHSAALASINTNFLWSFAPLILMTHISHWSNRAWRTNLVFFLKTYMMHNFIKIKGKLHLYHISMTQPAGWA